MRTGTNGLKRDAQPTDALDLAAEPCDDCARTTRWERRDLSPTGEAWLGTCETCGSRQVQALDAPEMEIEDPLAFFLLGVPESEPAPSRPPWPTNGVPSMRSSGRSRS